MDDDKIYATEIRSLLRGNTVFDVFYTHVSLWPCGKFSLSSREILDKFWFNYTRAIQNNEGPFGIAEVPQNYIPVIADIDLKFSPERAPDEGHFYSESFVRQVVECYQNVLREDVIIESEEQLDCVWLDKPAYSVVKGTSMIWKNGFHLHFPNLFISKIDQEIRIIPQVLKALESGNKENFPCAENINNFLDATAIGNTWLLYGSVKEEGMEPYRVRKIFNARLEELSLAEAFCRCKIFNGNEDSIEITGDNYSLFYPRIFSILPYGRKVSEVRKEKSCIRNCERIPKQPNIRAPEVVRSETSLAKELVDLLKPERTIGHNDWMMIGWALYNITNGSEQGLDIWIKFSLQSDDHDEARCIYEWNHMVNRGSITIGTLKYFARQDNPIAYTKLIASRTRPSTIRTTEKGLADLFHNHCQSDFIYCKKRWYVFVGHYWKETDKGLEVRERLTQVLIPLLKNIRQSISVVENDEEDDQNEKKRDAINRVIDRLETFNFLTSIMGFCEINFHDQEFEDKLNSDKYLIGFKNGVFDLQTNIFRAGHPSDYISNHMPINYKIYDPTDREILDLNAFFEKVFVSKSVRRYFLDIMSESFVGYNHRKHVFFWTGSGNNAKSITQMFFEKMFGRLNVKAPTTLITSKRPSSGSATAEMSRLGNGVRLAFLEEPNPDEEIMMGILKHLSGNDSFYSRDLYQAGRDVKEIIPMFKMHIICNDLPRIKRGGDEASWNRIRVIPFDSMFKSNAPIDKEEQLSTKTFPVDPSFDQKIPLLVEALAWLLLEHRKQPRIEDPEEVQKATTLYKNTNDRMANFVDKHLVIDEEARAISSNDMFEYFKEYLKISNMPLDLDIMQFERIISRYIGEPIGTVGWQGYRYVSSQSKDSQSKTDTLEHT